MPRLILRTLLTAAGWSVGSFLLAFGARALEAVVSPGVQRVAFDPRWLAIGALGGAMFALAAAGLRGGGSRWSASRRVLGVLGGFAMLGALVALGWYDAGDALDVVTVIPALTWTAVGIGAALGWGTLAAGGARE
jgi:hypothetical protein